MFEKRYLEEIRKSRFADVLEAAHGVVSPSGIRATLSMGVGREGESFEENFKFAQLGVEMALSRGGDQAVVKNRVSFEFFGGRGGSIETRTRVKSRVMANALGQLISGSSSVYVMGHRVSDFDAVGAAVGVTCIARSLGKPCRIVIDETKTAANPFWSVCTRPRSTPTPSVPRRRRSCTPTARRCSSSWTRTAPARWRTRRCWRAARASR